MGIVRKWSKVQRDQVVLMRKAGTSWPKISKELGIPRSTCIGIWKEDSDGKVSLPKVSEKQVEEARVIKMVPNKRLMLIHFDDREGVFKCVKRPENNHPLKSVVFVKKVEGSNDLYRIA
jgi:hypothetical protein|tara:strand:+ start:254 stop:610 length:357 start_codon:yes stop_codon:yes gene_type:complete